MSPSNRSHVSRLLSLATLLLLLAAASTQAADAQCLGQFTPAPASGPGARDGGAIAFDSARGRAVLFGGVAAGVRKNDTWEWNGTSWLQVASSGPTARAHAAMVYDSARGRCVLFGGIDTVLKGDTWEWDGVIWSQVATTGPSPRMFHAMAYDAARGRTVLYGGFNGIYQADTWEWNGSVWTPVPAIGPSARYFAAMAYDAPRGQVLLFGGIDAQNPRLGDSWGFNGVAWTPICAVGPSPRYAHSLAFDSLRGRVVLFGGSDAGSTDAGDAWEWNGGGWSQAATYPPVGRNLHMMVYDSWRSTTLIFGGKKAGADLGDTWRFDGPAAPKVVVQPVSPITPAGQTALLSIVAEGSGELSYRWRRNGLLLADDGRVTGAHTPLLTIHPATTADIAAYDCIVQNICGATRSDPAAVVITLQRGDMNCDGVANNFDIDPFVLAIFDPAAYALQYAQCN